MSKEYNFKSRPTGKSFAMIIQLKSNIEKGLKCVVATLDPEKTKRDFEYMTGSKLILKERGKGIYYASLNAL